MTKKLTCTAMAVKTIPIGESLVSPTLTLGVVLFAISGAHSPVLVSLAIFFLLSLIGSMMILSFLNLSAQEDRESAWQLRVGGFLTGGTIGILSWELSIAVGVSGFFGISILFVCVLCHFHYRMSKRSPQQFSKLNLFHFVENFTSTTVLSLLLFVATVPNLRSWVVPIATLNVLAHHVPRFRTLTVFLALIGTALVIRLVTADRSVLVFSDDSIWAEAFSTTVQQNGFWSWFGASDVYSPYHWIAYGIAGWFTRFTESSFLFGVTMAFPATMMTVAASIISGIRVNNNRRLSFTKQVLLIIVVLQLSGSQSISADFGFVAVLIFTLLVIRNTPPTVLTYITLICIPITKIQFVPVIAIVIVVSNILNVHVLGMMISIRRTTLQLGAVLVTSLIVLDKIPLSKIFGWETNAGWGSSYVRFRGPDLTEATLFREVLSGTFFMFVPAIVIVLIYLVTSSAPQIHEIAVALCVTASSIASNIFFEIVNVEYFSWISGALCALYLTAPIFGETKASLSNWLRTSGVGVASTICLFIILMSRAEFDKWQSLRQTQVVVSVVLAASVVLKFVPRISHLRSLTSLRSILGFGGVTLLCLPLLISTTDSFRESGFSIVTKSGYSHSDLGYTDDLLQAGEWVRQHTDPDEVIATNVLCEIGTACFLDGRPIISAATHRRTFIEAERFAYGYSPIQLGGVYPSWIVDRLHASMNCASSGDDASCSVLRSAGVELILIDTTRVSESNGLEVCATFGSIQVVSIQSSTPDSNDSCREGKGT